MPSFTHIGKQEIQKWWLELHSHCCGPSCHETYVCMTIFHKKNSYTAFHENLTDHLVPDTRSQTDRWGGSLCRVFVKTA